MSNLAGSSKLLRAMNSTAALSLLLERGRITRGDLRAATGLSKPTVSEALRRLVDADLALVDGVVRGGPGPNAEIYAVNAEAAFGLAISVGTLPPTSAASAPASITAALCDVTGTVRAASEAITDLTEHDPVELLTATALALIDSAAVPRKRVGHLQLGVAGAFDRQRQTIHHIGLPGFAKPGLVADLAARLGVDVEVDNDVNLAALAERGHGRGAHADSFALLWLGEGLGVAIDLGGQLLRGARGGAGEIGYLPMRVPGPAGGPTIDLQDLLGGVAVAALARDHGIVVSAPGASTAAAADASPDASSGASSGASAGTPAEAVAAGLHSAPFVAELGARVATAVGIVVAVLDPDLVVLAGPVARAGGAALVNAVQAVVGETALPDTPIVLTEVEGDPIVRGGLDAAVTALHARLHARLALTTP